MCIYAPVTSEYQLNKGILWNAAALDHEKWRDTIELTRGLTTLQLVLNCT